MISKFFITRPIFACVISAFIVIGLIPLLPFVARLAAPGAPGDPFVVSAVLTAVAFFLVGAAKSRFVEQRWYAAGLETLFIGGAAAAVAYVVGSLLSGVGTVG